MKKDNIILHKCFDFSLMIIDYAEILETNKKYVLAKQLLRSGTSIGANVREAQRAESKADFKHKMNIALKEAEESEYWLLLCGHASSYPKPPATIMEEIKSILRILVSIVKSS